MGRQAVEFRPMEVTIRETSAHCLLFSGMVDYGRKNLLVSGLAKVKLVNCLMDGGCPELGPRILLRS